MPTILDARTISNRFPGIGRYGYQLARAIARQKDRDELVLLTNPGSSTRFKIADLALEPRVRIVPTEARPFTAREQLLLPGELRKLRPDVTHFPYFVMPCLAPRPAVLTIHDLIPARLPRLFTFRQRILYRASLSLALRAAAVVICISQATQSDLQSLCRVDRARTVVIPEAAADTFQPRAAEEIERVRAAHHLPGDYTLFVGSNKPHKNLPALIEAYSGVPGAPALVIAGHEDPRDDGARRAVERLNLTERVRFAGGILEDDLPALYSGARAFIFPSLYEGFGLPPLEAMACGVPVACSGIPSLRETAGDAALYFDPKDKGSIAGALERILVDGALRADLRIRGLRRASELSWDVTAKKTLQAYRLAQTMIRD